MLDLQTPLLQSGPLLHRNPSAHFFVGRQLPPQSKSVSFPFRIWSLHLGTTTDKLKYFISQMPITTLTDVECTDTTNTVWSTITSQPIGTSFRGQTVATTVYVSLIAIHSTIITS